MSTIVDVRRLKVNKLVLEDLQEDGQSVKQ